MWGRGFINKKKEGKKKVKEHKKTYSKMLRVLYKLLFLAMVS